MDVPELYVQEDRLELGSLITVEVGRLGGSGLWKWAGSPGWEWLVEVGHLVLPGWDWLVEVVIEACEGGLDHLGGGRVLASLVVM